MKRIFSRENIPAEIPTASMADIAFLLIIFFMVTTVFTATKGIKYNLPKNEPTNNIQPRESVYIHLKSGGEIIVDFRSVNSIEELASYIAGKMKATQGKKPVIIRTDPDVPYGRMVDVLDLLRQLKVKNISIPTETEIQQWKNYFRD